jgi:hypothetical protein
VHAAGDVAIHELQLSGDPDVLAAWLGEHRIRVSVQPGGPALRAVVLATPAGEIVVAGDRA